MDINEAIRLDPDSHKAFCLRARADLAAGKQAQAIEDARRAIHLDANCGDAFLTLGSAILSRQANSATRLSRPLWMPSACTRRRCRRWVREQAIVYYNLSVSLHRAGETAAAKKAFDEALRLDPTKYAAIPRSPLFPERPYPKLVRREVLVGRRTCLTTRLPSLPLFSSRTPRTSRHCWTWYCVPTEERLGCRGRRFQRVDQTEPAFGGGLLPAGPGRFGPGRLLPGQVGRHPSDSPESRLCPRPPIVRCLLQGKGFRSVLANVAEAMRLDRKAGQQDLQAELRARDLYVEIYQAEARLQRMRGTWKMAVDSLVAIEKLKETLPFPYRPRST